MREGVLAGIGRAHPDVQAKILKRGRTMQFWDPPPIVVDDAEWIGLEEANEQIQSRWAPWPTIRLCQSGGYVQTCFRVTDGLEGVTRASLQREIEWRRTARFRNHVERLLHRLGGRP